MPATYEELHQRLLKEREALMAQLNGLHGKVREEGVGYGNHMADAASEVFEQARDISVRQRIRHALDDVLHALAKFEDGTYGICESCGGIIALPRLEALPSARYCMACQRRLEGTGGRR